MIFIIAALLLVVISFFVGVCYATSSIANKLANGGLEELMTLKKARKQ